MYKQFTNKNACQCKIYFLINNTVYTLFKICSYFLNTLSINSVVFKESKGNIWIGTWTEGVYFYNTSLYIHIYKQKEIVIEDQDTKSLHFIVYLKNSFSIDSVERGERTLQIKMGICIVPLPRFTESISN